MRIRHLVTRDNVDPDAGTVIDPLKIRHGIIVGARVNGLAGPIDPLTHLNLDFPDHRVTHCLIVEAFKIGAPAAMGQESFEFARVHPADYRRLGRVDLGARRQAWFTQFAAGEKER